MRCLVPGLLGLLALCNAMPAVAQAKASLKDSGDAAHLFAYIPRENDKARFDEGYRAHLDWHRDKRDPLVWYGWYVANGERVGMFIDGSFGAPFAAFDQRVDPKNDAADAVRTFVPFATDAFRTTYRVRREFSTGFPLEQWQPSTSVQVFHYTVRAGTQARFENVLQAVRETLGHMEHAPAHTWYELVVGGGTPGYMLMIAREGWADYGRHDGNLERLIAASGDRETERRLLDDLAAAVVEVKSETWSYRKDLSYIPGDPPEAGSD